MQSRSKSNNLIALLIALILILLGFVLAFIHQQSESKEQANKAPVAVILKIFPKTNKFPV